jgi:hypothetical protein
MPRMAFYTILLERFQPKDGTPMPFPTLLTCGFVAGGVASAIGEFVNESVRACRA